MSLHPPASWVDPLPFATCKQSISYSWYEVIFDYFFYWLYCFHWKVLAMLATFLEVRSNAICAMLQQNACAVVDSAFLASPVPWGSCWCPVCYCHACSSQCYCHCRISIISHYSNPIWIFPASKQYYVWIIIFICLPTNQTLLMTPDCF